METVSIKNSVSATLDCSDAARRLWDVVIVGAGPTGALAARQLALAGADVLLVDRLSFPRWKVCGCCLNGRAVSVLEQAGVLDDVRGAGAVSLNAVELRAGRQSLTLALPQGLSLSRTQLDALLVRTAIDVGADFLPETEARLGPLGNDYRKVVLTRHAESVSVRGRVVLVCEGLNQRLLSRSEEFSNDVNEHSFIGAGAVTPLKPGTFKEGTIFMVVGRAGYVGAVLVEDGILNLAAALNPGLLKHGEHLGMLVDRVLQEAGFTLPVDVEQLSWQGTAKLTRNTSPVATDRVLVLGDASGYVEPFTGEGMGWGLASAVACVPIVLAGLKHWDDSLVANWKQYHQRHIQGRQKWCRRCAYVLKRPLLVKSLIGFVNHCPWIASPVVRHLNAPWPQQK